MKFFPKGAWGYALLLIVLFTLAAVATRSVVDLVGERFCLPDDVSSVQAVSLAIWLLTMGFMFLAGALGLWAISATAEYESRHRIAKMVTSMNNLSDGLLAVDQHGYVRGANPAVRRLATGSFASGRKVSLSSLFPNLAGDELKRLLNKKFPCEIEWESVRSRPDDGQDSGLQILRLRSQPAEGLNLIFVSDITEKHTTAMRQHQLAKLHLLGRIAGGVAHDFSNILSAISGHAALMLRFGGDRHSMTDSLNVIMNETQRGVRLSGQLLALSRSSDVTERSCANIAENVGEAAELLRVALPADWSVALDLEGSFPPVSLSSAQIVQIVLNLGLLVSDALKKTGKLSIQLKRPVQDSASVAPPDFNRFAALVVISASAGAEDKPRASFTIYQACSVLDTSGVIPSVVRTIVEDAGGRLDEIYAGGGGMVYCVYLPLQSVVLRPDFGQEWPRTGRLNSADLRQWKIIMASGEHKMGWLEKMLADSGAAVERKATVDALLGAVDSDRRPEMIIMEKTLFGAEADSILRAIHKICPRTGLVIISRYPEEEALRETEGYVFIEPDADEDTWLNAILKTRQSLKT